MKWWTTSLIYHVDFIISPEDGDDEEDVQELRLELVTSELFTSIFRIHQTI